MDSLSITDQAELNRLQLQTKELERQIELQKRLNEDNKQAMLSETMDTLNMQKTRDLSGNAETYRNVQGTQIKVKNGETDIVTATRNEIEALQKLKDKRNNMLVDDVSDIIQEKEFEDIDKQIQKYDNAISEQIETLNTLKASFEDANGVVLDGLTTDQKAMYDSINSIIDNYLNLDLTESERNINKIQSFFDGTKSKNILKDQLLEAVKAGKDVGDAMSDLGLSLEDLGLKGESSISALTEYFNNLASAAENAGSSIDGSFSGVKAAFESENKGATWDSMADYLKQANELYTNGKIGTDEFQATAQWMMPTTINEDAYKYDAEAYKAAWEQTYNTVKRWFDADNPINSMWNFADDLQAKGAEVGKTLIDINKQTGEIVPHFESTAEAAKALGVNAQVVDTVLRNLEDYGFEFDDVMFSGEAIETFKGTLESIRSIYEEMSEGASKDRLGELIKGWDDAYSGFEEDLSTLTEDQIINIKFEYDLASLQSEIDKTRAEIEGGDATTENFATVIAGNDTYIKSQKDNLQADKIELPAEIKLSEDSIEQTRKKMRETTDEEEKIQLQAELSNEQEVEKSLLNAFRDAHPEITPETDITEVQTKMNEFFSQPQHITVDADIVSENGTKSIEDQLSSLSIGSTITFNADVDGVNRDITALKNEDGTITYSANVEGVDVPIEVTEKEGTVSFKTEDSKVQNYDPPDKHGIARYKGDFSNIGNAPTRYGKVVYTAVGAVGSAVKNAKSSVFNNGTLLSPAHANGTAYNVLNLGNAYSNGRKVALDHDENAVVNELGTEGLIRNGQLYAIPGGMHIQSLKKGDIVLSVDQMNKLFAGKDAGTARAYSNGTLLSAYATGGFLPTTSNGHKYTGVSKSSTKSSSSSSVSASSGSNAVSNAAEAAEDLYDFIEILLDRTKEVTEKLTDAIDNAVSLADKMSKNSSALTQVQKEITVNQQAYQKYLAQANAVGLAEGYASQIRNGSLNIENITDEDLKKKIDQYKSWFEKAKSCQDAIRDLQKDEKELALSRLEYIEDYYDSIIKLNDAYKDVSDARIEFNDAIGNTAIGKEVQDYLKSSYDKQYDSYNKALTQLSDYQNEFNELVRNGYINEGSEAWYEGQTKIQEFTKQVDESATALIELEDKIREIDYTKLQQIIEGSDRRTDQLKNAQSLAEARDEQIVRDEYQKQVDELSKNINANYALRDKKLQEQNLYDVTSTRYQDLAKEIADLDGEIYSSLEDIEDLKNKIFETEFFNYEKEQENLKYFISE